jgi:broad specificity phosphatase PhoE
VRRRERWPASIVIVRHGESAGNVAREHAEAQGRPFIDIAARDMDVPLSELGQRQAQAVGLWIATLGRGARQPFSPRRTPGRRRPRRSR